MKKMIFFSLIVSLAGSGIVAFKADKKHTDLYNVDIRQSSLQWYGRKVTGEHKGTIMLSGGQIKNDHGNLAGTFEIDMNTIENTDQTGEPKANLENHLKSDAFFGVAKFPKSTFVLSSVTPVKEPKSAELTHSVKGNLTIKDKTNEITFDVAVKMESNKMTFIGEVVVDRAKFDVRYGSKSFFPDIGDKMIYDEFTMKLNVVAFK